VTSAQLDQALVDERRSVTTMDRDEAQFRVGGISAAQLDESRLRRQFAAAKVVQLRNELEVARLPGRVAQVEAQTAQVSVARAALERARWELDQKSVAATRAGRVHDTPHRDGDWVAAGAVVVRLLPPENIKVRFFVPQAVAAGLTAGRAVLIRGAGEDLPAKVDFVSTEAEFTPPVIYSNETSRKLVFMAEARPDASAATRLQPGQPLRVLLR
jgi:HlyD family secretion protein